MKLFAVYLGGKAKGSTIEVHDIVFVIGEDIKKCLKQIKAKWFGDAKSVHIDSWTEISTIDGYRIELSENKKNSNQKLFFINLGYSLNDAFGEQHLMTFLASTDKEECKIKAKSIVPINSVGHHIDNIILLDKIDNWYIHLIADPAAINFKFENVYWKI